MAAHDPVNDPDRTVTQAQIPDSQPDTVDRSQPDQPTDATGPYLPVGPTDAPEIPGYNITELIASGGMGKVYAAIDLKLKREVAIKTLLPGANSERFVAEAGITAQLPHPNIPPVHELGTLADGTPFVAMKRINGQTLAELLKARTSPKQDLPRFVQIFEQIAQAVGFAHARGIIHRDLKPLNVMVGEFGEVQVMDWGLAKDLQTGESTESTVHTETNEELTLAGTIMGTPGYMAPEQARGEAVDARADVFALGAMLAAILTGKPAFVGTTARETIDLAAKANLEDVLARLQALRTDQELVEIAINCLAAKPEDRPTTGQEVANAIAHYRAGVEDRLQQAKADEAAAVTRADEQSKRRRALTWAGGIIAIVLLGGLSVSLWQMNRAIRAEGDANTKAQQARDERDAKENALQAEKDAKELAESKRIEAENNLGFARKGNEILGSVFEGLDPRANYANVGEFSGVLKANLHKAVAQLEDGSIGDPLTVARMQNKLGLALIGMGEAKQAVELFEKAHSTFSRYHGNLHPDTLTAQRNTADGCRLTGNYQKAIELYLTNLKYFASTLGSDHPATLTTMNNLAIAYSFAGEIDKGLPLYEKILALSEKTQGLNHPETLTFRNNLADGYRMAGKMKLAGPLYEQTLQGRKNTLGPDHPLTLASLGSLADYYQSNRMLDLAIPLLEESHQKMQARLGRNHPETLARQNNLASGYQEVGEFEKAIILFEETSKIYKAKLGPDHPDTLVSIYNVANCYERSRNLEMALQLYEETFNAMKSKLGENHPLTLTCSCSLADSYAAIGQLSKAMQLYDQTLQLRRTRLGPHHPDTLLNMGKLASAYQRSGYIGKALPLYEETSNLMKEHLGPEHPNTFASMNNLNLNQIENRSFSA